MLKWIKLTLRSLVLKTCCFCSTDFALHRIVWLLFSSVHNSKSYCSTNLVLQWILWWLFSSILNSNYLVLKWILLLQFLLSMLNLFGVTMNSGTIMQFSSLYMLSLLNWIGVTLNCVTVIYFSSQYLLLLFNWFGSTVCDF